MAGTRNTYDFQEGGLVQFKNLDTGETYQIENNLVDFSFSYDGDPEESEIISCGDAQSHIFTGPMPSVGMEVSLKLYDETGTDEGLEQFQKNTPSGQRMEITIRPQGTGAGLKEWVLTPSDNRGFYITSGGYTPAIDTSYSPAEGEMKWKGKMAVGPKSMTQS